MPSRQGTKIMPVGATLATHAEVSRGRMALIDLSGLGGAVAGFAVGQAFESPDERLAHFTLVGLATGLITGTFVTASVDRPSRPALRPAIARAAAAGDGGLVFGLAGSF